MIGSIFFLIFAIFFLQILFFVRENNQLKKKHAQLKIHLKSLIRENRQQILLRNFHLEKYHFLRYNLKEVLVSQNSISLV